MTRHYMTAALWTLFFGLATVECGHGNPNWPRWRGPSGDGHAPAADLPTYLSAGNIMWRAPLPGVGNGSPVIWNDRLFLQAASEDGRQRLLLACAVKDGKVLWQMAKPGRGAKTHAKNTLASSTPAVDAQRVVFAVWDGAVYRLVACNHDGKELWTREIGPFASHHGAAHSPLLHNGLVYFVNDHDDGAVVHALDAGTGEPRWEKQRPVFKASYSTPLVHEGQLLVASTAGVTAYDLKNGSMAWDWKWPHLKQPLRMCSSPVLAGDLLVAACGDGAGDRHTVAIRLGSSPPQLVWQLQRGVPYVPGLVPVGERLFFVTDQGVAGALETATGKTVWSDRLGGNGNVSASPIFAGGHLYDCNEDGELFVWKAGERFELVSRLPLESPVIASPAVGGNRLFIRTKVGLVCVGKAGNAKPLQP